MRGFQCFSDGMPDRVRTGDPQIRNLVLCPAELQAHTRKGQKADNRTQELSACRLSAVRLLELLDGGLDLGEPGGQGVGQARAELGVVQLRVVLRDAVE